MISKRIEEERERTDRRYLYETLYRCTLVTDGRGYYYRIPYGMQDAVDEGIYHGDSYQLLGLRCLSFSATTAAAAFEAAAAVMGRTAERVTEWAALDPDPYIVPVEIFDHGNMTFYIKRSALIDTMNQLPNLAGHACVKFTHPEFVETDAHPEVLCYTQAEACDPTPADNDDLPF